MSCFCSFSLAFCFSCISVRYLMMNLFCFLVRLILVFLSCSALYSTASQSTSNWSVYVVIASRSASFSSSLSNLVNLYSNAPLSQSSPSVLSHTHLFTFSDLYETLLLLILNSIPNYSKYSEKLLKSLVLPFAFSIFS